MIHLNDVILRGLAELLSQGPLRWCLRKAYVLWAPLPAQPTLLGRWEALSAEESFHAFKILKQRNHEKRNKNCFDLLGFYVG